ncbi:hypothetical protein PFISCL1PPCAC_7405, partial [Pristionchus fissidentatus]
MYTKDRQSIASEMQRRMTTWSLRLQPDRIRPRAMDYIITTLFVLLPIELEPSVRCSLIRTVLPIVQCAHLINSLTLDSEFVNAAVDV